MWDFITENKEVSWVLIVIAATMGLRFLTKMIFSFLERRDRRRGSSNEATLKLLRRICIVFIYAFGILLASYAMFEKEVYETINRNILTVIWIAVVLIFTIIGAALSQRYFDRKIESSASRDKQDPTAYRFLNYFVTFFIWFIGLSLAAFAIPALRGLAQSALAGAGVLTVIAGIASQEGISNIAGGILIVFFRPFRIGDTIEVGSSWIGVVEDLTLRHTVIRDFHNNRIVIPNATMNKETVTNYNLGERKICKWLEIGISYDSDVEQAMEIIRDEIIQHAGFLDHRSAMEKKNDEPSVKVKVVGLRDSSVNIRAWLWAKDLDTAYAMTHDLYKSIKGRFDQQGVEIPFPHRVVVYKNQGSMVTNGASIQEA